MSPAGGRWISPPRAEADEAEAEAVEAENDENKKEARGQGSGSDGERMTGAPPVAVEVVARRALAVAVRGAAAVLAPRALTRGPRRRGRGVGGGHLGACRSGDGEGGKPVGYIRRTTGR